MTEKEPSEAMKKALETFEGVRREMEQPPRILTLDEMQAFAARQEKEQQMNNELNRYPVGHPMREKIEERFRNESKKSSS